MPAPLRQRRQLGRKGFEAGEGPMVVMELQQLLAQFGL
jgi:hypothetical protein